MFRLSCLMELVDESSISPAKSTKLHWETLTISNLDTSVQTEVGLVESALEAEPVFLQRPKNFTTVNRKPLYPSLDTTFVILDFRNIA